MENDSFRAPTLYILLSGGIAGCVAKTLIAPFDRVKIHFQIRSPMLLPYAGKLSGVFSAVHQIYSRQGIFGLYRGHSAMLLRIFPYAAINYYAYERAKGYLYGKNAPSAVPSWKRILAGASAGAVAVTCTYPLDVLRARLAFDLSHRPVSFRKFSHQNLNAIRNACVDLMNEGRIHYRTPLFGFYQGYFATLLGIMPYAGVSYYSFETLKILYSHYRPETSSPIPSYAKLILGMISGAIAQTAAYPLDIVRRRLQLRRVADHLAKGPTQDKGIFNLLRSLVKERGIRGLFTGLSINYIKVAPATGVSFMIYEKLKEVFVANNK